MTMTDTWRVGVLLMTCLRAIESVRELVGLLIVHAVNHGFRLGFGYRASAEQRRKGETWEQVVLYWLTILTALWLLKEIDQKCHTYQSQCDEFIQELQKQKKQLSDKNKYIATLTHEMRNIATR